MTVTRAASDAVKAALQNSHEFSAHEKQMLSGLSGADLDRATAQLTLQKQQETVAFISKLLKNDTTMQTLNNLK
ncbi:hypothetical protein F0U60_26420 [Archangium minus]|uniref:Uncharacterized protein n=1 Tax=Archangium minus TaxID=83450 RepID=A0ABY9WUX2_9BACT|nr:hypothetical protein F0U61_26730 [Archangium violaceum]WNG47263.1 hypothetical protein F0U60_26420 [Archangium minus]